MPSYPLRKSEILALVAGGIMPENIAYDIQSRGVAFVRGDSFDTLLQNAGADAKIFAALKPAKVTAPTKPESSADQALLKCLSRAGSLIRSGQLDFAADKLNNCLSQDLGKPEIGFVMGLILINQQRFEEAGQVYLEILSQDSNFQKSTRDSVSHISKLVMRKAPSAKRSLR